MARGPANASGDDTESSSRPGKRRCVQSACVPCRKRKSKCDGGTPVCATCTAVYKTDCYYDEASETRRSKASASKRDTPSSSSQADTSDRDHADFLIKTLRTLPDTEAAELAKQISDPRVDLASLAETYRRSSVLPFSPASDKPSLESDLSLLMGKPSVTIKGETRLFGHSSNLGLVREDEDYNARPHVVPLSNTRYANGIWTSVTQDAQFIDDLLNLYFEWSHSFYVIFSRECFLRDFRSGRHKYCSPLLVNAILAYACHFSDDPRARTNPADPRTAGDHFFAEARQLLYEDETPSLTQTQALCIMAIREPSAGRDSSGFLYIGRCMRMAVELGMHLEVQTDTKSSHNLTPSEIEVRRVTFWGCFIVDACVLSPCQHFSLARLTFLPRIWSLCIGRVAQLPKSAITVKVPTVEEATYDPPPDSFRRTLENPGQTSRMFMESFAKLAELINDNNYMFYAPKERTTSRRLLKMYREYKEWYNELPPRLHLPTNPNSSGKPMAHILVLQ